MELEKNYTNRWFSQSYEIDLHNQYIVASFVCSLPLVSRQPLRRMVCKTFSSSAWQNSARKDLSFF
jgi:hypothetical protein